jgi:flagellar L-ring protein precursor FlgH
MQFKTLYLISLIFLFVGCSKSTTSINMDATPNIQIPKKAVAVHRKKGALYSRQGASLFADKKDLQIGDILQVIVQEALKNDSKGSRAIKKNSATSLGGGLMTPITGVSLGGRSQRATNKVNETFGVGFKANTANSFAGSASSKVDEKFTTTISVIIEQTYQNGNYFVKGSKEMLIDGQKQSMSISGVIRPYDKTPENTVYSHQLANLKIKYVKGGEENDSNHKAWGTELIETIWPF